MNRHELLTYAARQPILLTAWPPRHIRSAAVIEHWVRQRAGSMAANGHVYDLDVLRKQASKDMTDADKMSALVFLYTNAWDIYADICLADVRGVMDATTDARLRAQLRDRAVALIQQQRYKEAQH